MKSETARNLSDVAIERASRYAPPPSHDPIQAGIAGGTIAGLSAVIYTLVAGLTYRDFPIAAGVTVFIGFVIPYGYLKFQSIQHERACAKEFKAIRDMDDISTPD